MQLIGSQEVLPIDLTSRTKGGKKNNLVTRPGRTKLFLLVEVFNEKSCYGKTSMQPLGLIYDRNHLCDFM